MATAMEDGMFDLAALPASAQEAGPPLGNQDEEGGQHLPDLQVGSRIKLRVGEEDRYMRLNWLSPMGGMYLFTNEDGGDALTLTLTRARLESKFRQGEATLVAKA